MSLRRDSESRCVCVCVCVYIYTQLCSRGVALRADREPICERERERESERDRAGERGERERRETTGYEPFEREREVTAYLAVAV